MGLSQEPPQRAGAGDNPSLGLGLTQRARGKRGTGRAKLSLNCKSSKEPKNEEKKLDPQRQLSERLKNPKTIWAASPGGAVHSSHSSVHSLPSLFYPVEDFGQSVNTEMQIGQSWKRTEEHGRGQREEEEIQ